MSETQGTPELIAIKLDSERRREIDEIRKRMEDFLRAQIDVSNELKLVVKGQDQLKERFEVGTARTLKELEAKFDRFISEWGEVRAENKHRDTKINDAMELADKADKKGSSAIEKGNSIVMGFAYTIFGSTALVALIWALSLVLNRGG